MTLRKHAHLLYYCGNHDRISEDICIEHGFRDRGEREYLATHSVIDHLVREDVVNRIEASRGWSRIGTALVTSIQNLPHLPTSSTLRIVPDN